MYNISNDTLSRVSARNRNRTSYAEVIDGLDYTYPLLEETSSTSVKVIIQKEADSFPKL